MTAAGASARRRVVLVGAGNIGSRLLQSLARSDPDNLGGPLEIIAVEPMEGARDQARARFEEALGGREHDLSFAARMGELPERSALLIIATDSRNRLAALQAGLSATWPDRLLLEKFLFTRRDEYETAGAAIEAAGVEAFVNCSRNVWPGYAAVKAELGGAPVSLSVSGGDWGLACNGVHFFALLEHVAGRPVVDVDASGLDPEPHPSKRAGYFELTGRISGRTDRGDAVEATSVARQDCPIEVVIRQGGRVLRIAETKGVVETLRAGQAGALPIERGRFEMSFASQLEATMEALITGRPTALPDYAQSAALHQRLAAAMNRVFHGEEGFHQPCPVT